MQDALLDDARAAAASADVAVVFAGLHEKDQSEGFDRTRLDLPASRVALIQAVVAVAKRTVVVLSNGGVVSLEPWNFPARTRPSATAKGCSSATAGTRPRSSRSDIRSGTA